MLAAKYKVSLYPVSTGLNWGYGEANPTSSNSVVINLSRMNKIISVNRDLAYAVVEPGVTQGQLAAYLTENKVPLQVDATGSSPECSLLGNALERGFSLGPYGDHWLYVTKIEAVLADGTLIKMQDCENSPEEHSLAYRWGLGPDLHNLFAQSNFGIVTKACLLLHPKKQTSIGGFASISEDKFKSTIDALRTLCLDKDIIPSFTILNQARLNAMNSDLAHQQDTSDKWGMFFGIYGDDALAKSKVKIAKSILHPLSDKLFFASGKRIATLLQFKKLLGRFISSKVLDNLNMIQSGMEILSGLPNKNALTMVYNLSETPLPNNGDLNPSRDNCGLMWHSVVLPMTGTAAAKVVSLVRSLHKDFPAAHLPSISFVGCGQRAMVATIPFIFNKGNEAQTQETIKFHDKAEDVLKAEGFMPYRLSNQGMGKYFDGSRSNEKVAAKIKSALDPENIISPGRYSR